LSPLLYFILDVCQLRAAKYLRRTRRSLSSSVLDNLRDSADLRVSIMGKLLGGGLIFGEKCSAFPIKIDQRNRLISGLVSNAVQKT
jgi:hypothetical protein